MDNSKPVDHPPQETVEVREGTGPAQPCRS
jgi:hypothetical protein